MSCFVMLHGIQNISKLSDLVILSQGYQVVTKVRVRIRVSVMVKVRVREAGLVCLIP